MSEDAVDVAIIEDSLRDPDKMPCFSCGGTGETNAPKGWHVIQPTCQTCTGSGLIRRGGVGPCVKITNNQMHTQLLGMEKIGRYRTRLLMGWEAMDGSTLKKSWLSYADGYQNSRVGLIIECNRRLIPFSFIDNEETGDLQWVIGPNPRPSCAKFVLRRLAFGDFCRTCGHAWNKHC